MTYELAEEILPFCKNCVEETIVRMIPSETYNEIKVEKCYDLSQTNSNLIYKKVSLLSLLLTNVNVLKYR